MNEPQLYKKIYGYDKSKFTQFDDSVFRLRPSSIDTFFSVPPEWYSEHIAKQSKGFEGNTGSVLGSTLHYCYECALNDIEIDHTAIIEAMDYHRTQANVFEIELVKQLYPLMFNATLDEYITPLKRKGVTLYTEEEAYIELSPTFVMRGLNDLRYNTTIVDWKNESKKPSKLDSIPFKYKIQLLAYAYMWKSRGVPIDTIEVVYTVRPTKTLGARCFSVKERISPMDWKLIEDTIQLIHESVTLVKNNPEYTHLVFKSMNLKQQPKPRTLGGNHVR